LLDAEHEYDVGVESPATVIERHLMRSSVASKEERARTRARAAATARREQAKLAKVHDVVPVATLPARRRSVFHPRARRGKQ